MEINEKYCEAILGIHAEIWQLKILITSYSKVALRNTSHHHFDADLGAYLILHRHNVGTAICPS